MINKKKILSAYASVLYILERFFKNYYIKFNKSLKLLQLNKH